MTHYYPTILPTLTRLRPGRNAASIIRAAAIGFCIVSVALPLQSLALEVTELTPQREIRLSNGSAHRLAGIVGNGTLTRPNYWRGETVTVTPLFTDRYGTAHSLIYRVRDKKLLQNALIEDSLAMAYSAQPLPDLTLSRQIPANMQLFADQPLATTNFWAAVSGSVHHVTLRRKDAFINFSADWKKDFTIYIPSASLKRMDAQGLLDLQGKTVTVRGWLHRYYGPRITLHNPQMLTAESP